MGGTVGVGRGGCLLVGVESMVGGSGGLFRMTGVSRFSGEFLHERSSKW